MRRSEQAWLVVWGFSVVMAAGMILVFFST